MKKYLSIICLVFSSCFAFAQSAKIDSLLILIKTDKEGTDKVIHLYKLCQYYNMVSEYDKSLQYGKQSLALAQNIGFKKGIANSYNSIGVIYDHQGNYPEALKNYFTSLKIYEEINDKQGVASSYNNIGIIYYRQGNYPEALKNHFAALKIKKEINDKKGIAGSYINIGSLYYYQGHYSEALTSYFAALKIKEEIKDKQGIGYSSQGIGLVYDKQSNYPEALKYYFSSLKIYEEIRDKDGIASSFINLGQLYIKLNKTKAAQDYLNKALQLSKEIDSKDAIKDSYKGLAILDSTIGNYKAAFEHHKFYIIYRDSLNNEETKKKSLQASMQYEFDKKETELNAKAELQKTITEEQDKRKKLIYSSIIFIITIVAFFLLNRQKLKSKKDKIIFEKQEALLQAEKQKAEDELLHAKKLLVNYTENLIDKNKAIEELQFENEKLKGLKATELYKEKIDTLDNLNNATLLTDEDWEKFKDLFEKVYKGFFTRLKDRLPNLTNAEIRLMSLVKLKLNNKQMGNMLGVSPDTITTTKYRLRKKINLTDNQEIDKMVESI